MANPNINFNALSDALNLRDIIGGCIRRWFFRVSPIPVALQRRLFALSAWSSKPLRGRWTKGTGIGNVIHSLKMVGQQDSNLHHFRNNHWRSTC